MDIWALSLTLLVVFLVYKWMKELRHLPPGPWNAPIVGYLPWLDPKFPYLTLTNLSRKYGPIYGLYLGSVYTVVVSDVKLVKKLFNKDSASGRAPLYLTHGIMKGFGLICAEGPLWKDQRKFVHNTLRMLGAAKTGPNKTQMQLLILEQSTALVNDISSREDKCFDVLPTLRHYLGSAINQMVFGKVWAQDDETWKWLQHLQEEGTQHIGVAGPLNFLSFLRFLPKFQRTINFLIDGKNKTHELYHQIIKEHSNNVHNDFIQAFQEEKNKRTIEEQHSFYNDEQFHHLLADIFGASLDTTLTTLRWYLLYLAVHQQVQDKVRQQMREVLGNNRPTMEDLAVLPYVEASISEVQRIRSVVPVGIPHGSLEEIEIEGYKIPKKTMIVPLQWAIHMDEKNWDFPESFKPERFINEEGKFFRPEAFIPFQAGKRMCVGDELARMFLFLFGATLIQNFHISCKNLEEVDLTGDCGITLTPKPHVLIFENCK